MKRYYDLTTEEKLKLSGDAIHDAIKLEAIHRGIKPPVTLEGVINQHGFVGFVTPPDSVNFYELCGPQQYGESVQPTGIAYKTEAEALRALENCIFLTADGYGADKKCKPVAGIGSVRVARISLTPRPKSFASTFQEYSQAEDDEKYETLSKEIQDELNGIWQADYNMRVQNERRKEYMRLAKGDEDVAKAFWSRSERTEWPVAELVPA